jgi:YesN/AraC family two-component response regulator
MTLSAFGLDIQYEAQNGIEAINAVRELRPDIAFLDINMDTKEDGLDACDTIKSEYPDIKVFFMSAYPKKVFHARLNTMDYDGYLEKPVNKQHLKAFLASNKIIQPI